MPSDARLAVFVVTTPGLEPLVADELRRIGVRDAKLRHGGVGCSLTWPQLGLAHLQLRMATRVLVRIGTFPAPGFRELERGLKRIDWAAWLPPAARVDLRVSSTGSALFHTGAIEERAAVALEPFTGEGAEQTVMIRLQHDTATVSLDASGLALHKRGWRQAVDDAPLRETLAAALVTVSGWNGKAPLHDPFCGSGTIAIEAMMIARRMPPGRNRPFAFQQWPRADEVRWERLVTAADADVVDRRPPVTGSDTSGHAIDAARANAARAGVGELITFEQRPAGEVALPTTPGWVVTNPPYGERLRGVAPAMHQFVDLLTRSPRWRGAVIAPSGLVSAHLAPLHPAAPDARLSVSNGGIAVQLTPFSGVAATP
jgi:putative N6-adenine-specific DNA methylase